LEVCNLKRNSTTLFLTSPGATTPIPWVNNAPDFSAFTEPTLSVLQQSWQDFVDSGEALEVIPDPEPVVEPPTPDWDGFNAYMLSDPMFKGYRDTVRTADGDLTGALFDAYEMVDTKGVAAFSLVWGRWVSVSGITVADREVIATVAEGFNLPSEFVTVIRG
jgi:hypothetical protein